jgi:hypothetical protein
MTELDSYHWFSDSSRRQHKKLRSCHEITVLCAVERLKWGGSKPGHRVVRRDRHGAWAELKRRYFVERPMFDDGMFRCR